MRWTSLAIAFLCGLAAAERPPNIVVLFADDAGYADFGFMTDAADWTPRIDSIAAAGARFTNAYMTGCVCSPSRAGLLTGRYQTRFGHENNLPPGYMDGGMDLDETTLADRLKALGYATGLVGKWHLGYPPPYHPNERGFTWFYGLLQGARNYFPYENPRPHQVIQENGKATREGGYVTDRFGDAAVRFIAKNKEKPFFLFLSFTAPHGPLQAKAEDLAGLDADLSLKRRKYIGLLRSLDANVGKVLDALKEHGLESNTLVVFTNDNGGQTRTGASNAPLRGRKGQLTEGGIRVPMCMRWPGVIEAGRVIDDPVISLDLLPTFVSVGGGKVVADRNLDGIDLGPLLRDKDLALPTRPFFWRKGGPGGSIAMRLGKHKLYFADRKQSAAARLFDLASEIGEETDIAGENEEVVARMGKMLADWEAQQVYPAWSAARRRRTRR